MDWSKSVVVEVPLDRTLLLLAVVVVIGSMLTLRYKVPSSLPWVGKTRYSLFAHTRASFASMLNVHEWLKEGYELYSKHGKSYLLPTFEGTPEIIIPNSKTKWLIDHPEHEVSAVEAHYDQLQGGYAFTDTQLLRNTFPGYVVRRALSRKAGALLPHTWDEAQWQLDDKLGFDTEAWREVPVMDTLMGVVSGCSNRFFVGLPLCRNKEFLHRNIQFAEDVGVFVALLSFVPRLLRPLVGPLLALPNRYHARCVQRFTLPVVKERLATFAHNDANPDAPRPFEEDYLTWYIQTARDEGRTKDLEPNLITRCLLPIEFAAIHTTTFAITNILFDLVSADPRLGYLEGIREEVERVYSEEQGVWSKQMLTKMVRVDSAIRESMRVSAFMTRAVTRKVLAKDGVKTDEGFIAPQGSMLCVNLWSRHRDPLVYPDPDTFDAFRFSRQIEKAATDAELSRKEQHLQAAQLSFVGTSEDFLPFGHGRLACPGRTFVNQELKMILAYLFMKYDLHYLDKRPEPMHFGGTIVPPSKATIKVRRRKGVD